MKNITLVLFVLLSVFQMHGQVANYSFSQSSATYSPLTSGTVLGVATANSIGTPSLDDESYPVTLPFTFSFNGIAYSSCAVNSNGFITFGVTAPAGNTYTPISGTLGYSGAIAAWGGDINAIFNLGGLTGDIIWDVIGAAPNREFVLQYRNFRPAYSTSTTLAPYINFQIILSETSNLIKFVYGNSGIAVGTTNSSTARQIGLRGSVNTDYRNRTNGTGVLFTASTAGTANNNTQAYSSLNVIPGVPTDGLTYTWTPPVLCTGTPVAGTVAPSSLNICNGSLPGNLVASGYSSGVSGLTFQWEESLDNFATAGVNAVGGTGATTATYTPPAYSGTPIYYRLKVTCTNSTLFAYSTVTSIANPANPTTQVTNANATNVFGVSATVNWTNGNGSRRLAVLSDSATITDPANGNAPALVANAAYAGTGQQIVYDGTAAIVNVTGLSNTTTYYVKVYEYLRCGAGPYDYYYNTSSGSNVFSFTTISAPVNDNCSTPTTLTVGVNFAANSLAATNAAATLSAETPIPSCGNFGFATNGKDVWFSVTVPASGNISIETDLNSGLTDSVLQVYSGTCGALVAVNCDDDGGNGAMSLLNLTGQTPGQVLLIRVHGYNGAQGSFLISAYDCPSATPAPTGNANQSFCGSATVANLNATGTAVKWYATQTGGTALLSTDALTTGTNYYASQTINCESFNRLVVAVTINPLPVVTNYSASSCDDDTDGFLVFDLTSYNSNLSTASGVTFTYYETLADAQAGTNPIANPTTYTNTTNPQTVYVAVQNTTTNCISIAELTLNVTPCYCIPTYTSGTDDGDLISQISITGTALLNNSGTVPGGPAYTYYTGQPNYTATLQAGSSYAVNVAVGTFGGQNVAVWIDYNDNFIFEPSEKVGFTTTTINGNGSATFNITLSCNPPLGLHRMRVRDVWGTTGNNIDPCINYGWGETEDYDVTIAAAVACPQPSTLGALNITTNSADLTWSIGCAETMWDLHLTTVGGGEPTGAPSNANVSSPFMATSLTPSTSYDFYVRADCDANGTSLWTGPFTFTTAALPPVNDDCSGSIALTPGGVFADNAMGGTIQAATTTAGISPTCQTTISADVWYSVVVPASGSITIETQVATANSLTDSVIAAFSGTCGSLTQIGCDDDGGPTGPNTLMSIMSLTALNPGDTIYIGVWKYGTAAPTAANSSFIISAYDGSLGTSSFDTSKFVYYPNPVSNTLNFQYSEEISKVQVINLLGQEVIAKSINASQGQIDMSGLPAGTYLVKLTADGNEKTIKVLKQ